MGKTAKKIYASYRVMPQQSRFWVYSESCYTSEDLEFREWIIKTRTNSGIHVDYLNNPSSWFTEDPQALINVYPNSWLFSAAYKPRHVLTPDDFHVHPIDGLRLNWPSLYDLMQRTGDYLLLRNQNLSTEHLNQPMNYILLDINSMLKGLSQNSNIEQVQEQLKLITKYIRTIEKHVSPMVGSDRLFLANFREVVNDKIMPQITHMIESRVLKDRLHDLGKIIKQVSTERNRILHFALNAHPVNPHPYEFSLASGEDLAAYPTQAARACLEQEKHLLTSSSTEEAPPPPEISLKNCPQFSLVTSDEEISEHYKQAIENLQELENFQTIITQITGLLDQAGEVYTIHQFKVQMLGLLDNINHFLEESAVHIDALIDENTQAYHKAIQAQQDLSVWKKWLTSEEDQIKMFIKNQDTLAQFPSSTPELAKTTSMAQANSREIIKHLGEAHSIDTSFKTLADKAQELDKLMGSMHGWITVRYQSKGLPAPEVPTPLQLTTPKPEPITPLIQKPNFVSSGSPTFFSSTIPTASLDYCPPGSNECPALSPSQTTNNNGLIALGLIIAIPTILIGLYLLLRNENKLSEDEELPGTPSRIRKFNKYLTQFEDTLAQIKGYEERSEQDLSDEYEPYVTSYSEAIDKAKRGHYDVNKLKDAAEDLNYFYEEYNSPSDRARAL